MSGEQDVIQAELVDDPQERSLATLSAPRMLISVDEAVRRNDERRDFMQRVLRKDEHYGVIPGTSSKPTLLKPGAEALNAAYGYKPDFNDARTAVLDFDGRDHNGEPFLFYERKCDLYALHPVTGARVWVGSGTGSCSSWEDKYRWRTTQRTCPTCGKAAIIKGKAEYGGGWVCFKKKDGCGAKFADTDVAITAQQAGRAANDRVADLANTILKMADKRALVAATINATGVSDLFTQDVNDRDEHDDDERDRAQASKPKPAGLPMSEDDQAKVRVAMKAANPDQKQALKSLMDTIGIASWDDLWARGGEEGTVNSILHSLGARLDFDPDEVPR